MRRGFVEVSCEDCHESRLVALLPEALWTPTGEVVELPAPDDSDVTAILGRVLRQARKDTFEATEARYVQDAEVQVLELPFRGRPLRLCVVPPAATAVSMAGTKSVERGPPVFRADHPFAFFIRDGDTDVVLFAGKVHRPEGCAGESTRGTTPQVVFGLAKGGIDARVASLASAGVEILTPSPRPPAAGWPSSRTTTATCCRSTRRASCLAEGPHALPRFRFAAAREFL